MNEAKTPAQCAVYSSAPQISITNFNAKGHLKIVVLKTHNRHVLTLLGYFAASPINWFCDLHFLSIHLFIDANDICCDSNHRACNWAVKSIYELATLTILFFSRTHNGTGIATNLLNLSYSQCLSLFSIVFTRHFMCVEKKMAEIQVDRNWSNLNIFATTIPYSLFSSHALISSRWFFCCTTIREPGHDTHAYA